LGARPWPGADDLPLVAGPLPVDFPLLPLLPLLPLVALVPLLPFVVGGVVAFG
jgi:hypothetical protein